MKGKLIFENGNASIEAPFLFEVRAIAQEEFPTKHEEHLNKIAKRILEPDTVL